MSRHVREYDPDYADARADDFRCPSCETPTRTGRYCDRCQDELDAYYKKAVTPCAAPGAAGAAPEP